MADNTSKYDRSARSFGYARASADDEDARCQLQALAPLGLFKIFEEKSSGAEMKRHQYEFLELHLQPGDTLYVTKLDRLGRNLVELEQFVTWLEKKGIELICLHQPIDLKSAMGRMILRQMAVFTEMESELATERTRKGMEAARKAGKRMGAITKRELWEEKDPKKAAKILADCADPAMSMNAIAKTYGITNSTLRRNWGAELIASGKLPNK
ncbi:recombinase family protein [Roseibium sp. RKSG952]|uniref:recombinase family protein n=1 Tax=Roseibium sp. RKSG952 TaxID=2529384 RepID=UPI0012BD1314|nr:recombinase family protein [Roseibium sp. RKSG952]MTH94870.1 recombinase family protein [Roseibium sp. RKSG952]